MEDVLDKKICEIINIATTCVEASKRNAEIANTVNKRMSIVIAIIVISLSMVIMFDKYLDYKSVYIPTLEQEVQQDGVISTQKQNGVD